MNRESFVGVPRTTNNAVHRPRLIQALEGSQRGALTVIRAPGGMGKTVLMADFIQRAPALSGIWITLDSTTASVPEFWLEAVRLLERFLPRAASGAESGTGVPQLKGAEARKALAPIFRAISRPITIVVDNYQLLHGTELDDDLRWLATTFPLIHLVVLTRSWTSLEDPATTVQLDTAVIGMQELLLTPEEAGQVLEAAQEQEAMPGTLGELMHLTGGIPVCVQALAQGLGQLRHAARKPSAETIAVMVSRPLRTAIEPHLQDRAFADFLCKSAVPEAVTVELARELTGEQLSGQLLLRAEKDGLAVSSVKNGVSWYTFPAPVREVLCQELRKGLPDLESWLHRRAARWHQRSGIAVNSFRHAMLADDLAGANRAVRHRWRELIHGHGKEVVSLLRDQPLRKLQRYPLLLLFMAICYNSSQRQRLRALEYFALAAASARGHVAKASTIDRPVMNMILSLSFRLAGFGEQAEKAATAGVAQLDSLSQEQHAHLEGIIPTAYIHFGLSLLCAGEMERALGNFRKAYVLADSAAEARSRFQAKGLAAMVLAAAGQVNEAKLALGRMVAEEWPAGWYGEYVGAGYHLASAFVSIEDRDFDAARGALAKIAAHRNTIEHWPQLMHAESLLGAMRGDGKQSAIALEEALKDRYSRPPLSKYEIANSRAVLAMLHIVNGKQHKAKAALSKCALKTPRVHVAHAHLAFAAGDFSGVLGHAPAALATFPLRHRSSLLLVHAVAAMRQGDSAAALEMLETSCALMGTSGLRSPLAFLSGQDVEQLGILARKGSPATQSLLETNTFPALLAPPARSVVLTAREIVVIRGLHEFSSNAELAASLFVSINTVKSQLRSAYIKLGVSTREEALMEAKRLGLFDEEQVGS